MNQRFDGPLNLKSSAFIGVGISYQNGFVFTASYTLEVPKIPEMKFKGVRYSFSGTATPTDVVNFFQPQGVDYLPGGSKYLRSDSEPYRGRLEVETSSQDMDLYGTNGFTPAKSIFVGPFDNSTASMPPAYQGDSKFEIYNTGLVSGPLQSVSSSQNQYNGSFGDPSSAVTENYQQSNTVINPLGNPALDYNQPNSGLPYSPNPAQPFTLGINQSGSIGDNTALGTMFTPTVSAGGIFGDVGSSFTGSQLVETPRIIDTSGAYLSDSTYNYFNNPDQSLQLPSYGGYDYSGYTGFTGIDVGSYNSGGFGFGFDFGGYNSGSFSFGFDFGSLFSPVILELDGDGVDITPVTGSNVFFDMAGTGYKQRTAWAGAGDAVLAFDADGDGRISERNEIVFTDWDPSAETDMEALAHVFDTNRNGKLDAGDAEFASFRVIVSNADGTTSSKTLAQAGLAAIGLTVDKTQRVLEDGSSIDGQTTFTRSNGTTGTAAAATFAAEDAAYRVKVLTTRATDGTVTVDNKMYDTGGLLASESKLVTSADRKTRTLSFDDDGDGVFDRVRTTGLVDNADGSRVETVTDRASGILLGSVTQTTTASRASVTIRRDDDGDGKIDQREFDLRSGDGSSSVTIQNLNEDGTHINSVTRTVSADGLTATTETELDNTSGSDLTTTDATVVAGDGTRTRTVTDTNNDGSLRDKTVTVTNVDGSTQRQSIDLDGDTGVDLFRNTDILRNGDNSVTTTVTEKNRDGSKRAVTTTQISGDGLTHNTSYDLNGDGLVDTTHKETTVIGTDGSRTSYSADYRATGAGSTYNRLGALVGRTVTAKDADGITRTTSVDADGNGKNDSVDQVVVASSGEVTETLSNYRPDGTTLLSRTITTTTADGLIKTIKDDRDGNGKAETKTVLHTAYYQNGGSGVATSHFTSDGALIDQTLVMTSANGLYTTTEINLDGKSGWDLVTNSSTVVGSDGVRTTTQATTGADGTRTADGLLNGDGTLQSKVITTLSADRNVTTITTDANGDGAKEGVETITKGADGTVTDVVTRYGRGGAALTITTTTTDDTGLVKSTDYNLNAFGKVDERRTDVTELIADGRRINTVKVTDSNGDARSSTRTQVSDDGLRTTVQTDVDGDGKFDGTTLSETVLKADGSRTTTVTQSAGGPSATSKVVSKAVTTVSDDGLSTTVVSDLDGNSLVASSTDRTSTDVTTLNADGKGGTSETVTHFNNKLDANGNLGMIDKVTTAISADRKTTTITTDLDGNTKTDRIETINVQINGDVVDTTTAYDAAGGVSQTTTVTTSADGLSTTRTLSVGNDTTIDGTQTRTLRTNLDGSTTEIVFDTNADDNIQPGSKGVWSRVEITTSADGLDKTTNVTGSSEGFDINHIAVGKVVLGADGSRAETRTITSAGLDGSRQLLNTMTISDSAHGLRHTVELVSGLVGNFRITDETIVNADGSTTRTYTDRSANSSQLFEKEVTWTSANGRHITIDHDTDGEGHADEFKTTTIEVDRTRTDAIWTTTNSGTLLSKTVTTTSADGRTQTITFDTDGDSVVDAKQIQVSVVNDDGSTTQTRSDTNGKDVLRDRITTTTSANGYRITGTIDLDGDGTIDETFSNQIVLNTDGTKTQTIQTKYADGMLKNRTVIQTSADGRHVVTGEDLNGNERDDVVKTEDVASSGVRTVDVRYLDAAGTLVSSDTTTISADGRQSTVSRDFDGDGKRDALEVESRVADGNGSYDIGAQDATSNGILFEGNHLIDENGVDHIYTAQRNQYRSTLYDPAVSAVAWVQTMRQGADDRAQVARIYDVMLDRDPTSAEKEIYVTYPTTTSMITSINYGSEFSQRYGTLTDAQFVEQMYRNAYGRSAKVSELNSWLMSAGPNKTLRTDVVKALTSSAEHLTVGSVHTVTSSSQNVSGKFSLEHTIDKMVAADIVDRIYSTGLGRPGTDSGAASNANQILAGIQTEANLAAKIVASSEFATRYGSLSDDQFVTQMFQNALGRAPTSTERSSWSGLLGAKTVSRGDLVVGLANDLDYRGVATTSSSAAISSAAAPPSVNARQASSFNRMVQAMSTMSEHPHAAWAPTFAATQTSQDHQLAAAHH